MNNEDLAKLAKDIYEGKVFGSWMIPENQLKTIVTMVFMPLAFMDEEQHQEMLDKEIHHFYEYYDKAGPRAINGFPIFWSFGVLTKSDSEKLMKALKRLEDLEKATMDSVVEAMDEE
jgi:hypothetical protein